MFSSIFSLLLVSSVSGQRSYYGYSGGGGHYTVLTRNKYSSSFQKVYRPSPGLSYHHLYHQPLYHYNTGYHYNPPYYHYQPYSQPRYYSNNSGKLISWLEAIKFNSDRRAATSTTEKTSTSSPSTSTASDDSSIKREKKDFDFSMTASKSIVSESHSVTVSTTSVVTSISSTISIKQLSTTTSSIRSTNSSVGALTTTTSSVFLVYPAVDDSGVDDGLTEDSIQETTLKPLSMGGHYKKNRNIFGLLSQLNQTVNSICKYSLVKRICTMRNIA